MLFHYLRSIALFPCILMHIHTIAINEDNGQDSTNYLFGKSIPCKTLSYALNKDVVQPLLKWCCWPGYSHPPQQNHQTGGNFKPLYPWRLLEKASDKLQSTVEAIQVDPLEIHFKKLIFI